MGRLVFCVGVFARWWILVCGLQAQKHLHFAALVFALWGCGAAALASAVLASVC